MRRITQYARHPRHIVIICKGKEMLPPVQGPWLCPELALQRMYDFKQIHAIEAGMQSLVALVIRDRIEHLRVRPAVVVAVDDLAHEPEVRALALAEAADALEEIEVDAVGGVETDAVDLELLDPVIDGVDQVVADADVLEIQLDEVVVAVPPLIPEGVAAGGGTAEVQVLEPAAVAGALTLLLDVDELRCA